ncbi:hypothetical protein [Okeania sp. SIO3B5]|uniref:hypothetical protein n=1 Tax=Okeania sp. SIO3B5 TaxID=2607811 RepID=UPI0025E4C8A7|nr:hypothetical protein [Okeania sp. SIO3B5]
MKESRVRSQESGGKKEEEGESFFITNYPDMILDDKHRLKENSKMTKETIETVVNSYFTNMAAMNAEAWAENFAEDGVTYDPVGVRLVGH